MTRSEGKARSVALEVLVRVDRDRAFSDRVLDSALKRQHGLAERDRALVTELVYGTLRHRIYLDFILDRLASRPLKQTKVEIRNALRMGAHQLLHMRVPQHAAVNETVNLVRSKSRGATGFVNALLRKLSTLLENDNLPRPDDKDAVLALATLGSHPEWLLRQAAERLGDDELAPFVASNNQTPALTIRANRTKTTRDFLAKKWVERGLEVDLPSFLPDGLEVRDAGRITALPEFQEGLCSAQDFAAQLVGVLAAARPGESVLDVCAAPGGKACHVAETMQDKGLVVALDVHPGRMGLVAQTANRLGLKSIRTCTVDASEESSLHAGLTAAGLPTDYDRVLLDAPCSGLGTLRRHPELRLRLESEIAPLVELQAKLLDSAAPRVKRGGHLVYSVCTVTREEGLSQIRSFLGRQSEFRATMPDFPAFRPMRCEEDGLSWLETWPHRHRMDGFFMVNLQRI